MNGFIDYEGDLFIPVQIVGLKFFEKEDCSLNSFQIFILEAIEKGSSIAQIVEATLLVENVIQTEITQMASQKLLKKDCDIIELTDVSKKILMVSRCVEQLNRENKKVCINLISGDIEEYIQQDICERKEIDGLSLMPRISDRDIDGISIDDNISFFSSYMNTFSELDDISVEAVLEAIYVEFVISAGGRGFRKVKIDRLPCYIQESDLTNVEKNNYNDIIIAKGCIDKLEFFIKSKEIEENKSVIESLLTVERHNAAFLSGLALELLKQYRDYKKMSEQQMVCYYDTVSGMIQYTVPQVSNIKKKQRVNLELPVIHELSLRDKKFILGKVREYYAIPTEFDLFEQKNTKENYFVECSIGELEEIYND